MRQRAVFPAVVEVGSRGVVLLLALASWACGGAVTSGSAVGKAGTGVSGHAHAVPQGAEVCALKEAMAAQAGGAEKSLHDSCSKQLKSDQLWRRSMVVLGAYGETLDAIASDEGAETAGQVEAAGTGVKGSDWIAVEDGPEKAAREAVAQLVNQMSTSSAKGDLDKTIKDAAPHVNTICDGLVAYLEAQARSLGEVHKEAEKKRVSKSDRRCGSIDNKPLCVSDSATDRVVYAHTFGQLALLEANHLEARDAVAGFCAAHKKLEEAAAKGATSDESTHAAVVDAVKSSRRPPPAAEAAPPASPPAAPAKK
jgi:hypothetical protein